MNQVDQVLSGITHEGLISEEVARKYKLTPTQVRFILCLHSLADENSGIVDTSELRKRLNLSEVSFYMNLKPLERRLFLSVHKSKYRNYFHLEAQGKAMIAYYKLLLKRKLNLIPA